MSHLSYPRLRSRRKRIDPPTRALVQETTLSTDSLILPVFVTDAGQSTVISTMPGVVRHNPDDLMKTILQAVRAGIRTFALFPHLTRTPKDPQGSEALNEKGLVPEMLRRIKREFPEVLCIADIALDPYTSHGQDGVIDSSGHILNDETVEILKKQALVCAAAGADIVAPSDMMDGRIGAIRDSLESARFTKTRILSYSAKYASAFYGPFREAVGSGMNLNGKSKADYQMDPANLSEAIHESALDLCEGADFLMVKPAGHYLDVIRRIKDELQYPTFAYQVSGEYAMIKFAAAAGAIDETKCMMESLLCIRRAGADAILTYFAIQAAEHLRKG